jgi:anti-sigma factor RsiW
MIDHLEYRELAAGAVLDDLDPAERDRLERHLATCPSCVTVSRQLDDVVWDLALLAPDVAPPASLHSAVVDAVRAVGEPTSIDTHRVAGDLAPAPGPTIAPTTAPTPIRRPRRRLDSLVPLALAAVLGVVAIGLGTRVAQLTQENAAAVAAAANAQAQLDAREGAMAVLVSPDHETATLQPDALAPDAVAVAVFQPGTTESYVMVANLPATPAGHVYQLWYADTAGVHPLGTFHHAGLAAFVAPFGVDLAGSEAAMITLEPEGGAVGEPGPQVIFGTL